MIITLSSIPGSIRSYRLIRFITSLLWPNLWRNAFIVTIASLASCMLGTVQHYAISSISACDNSVNFIFLQLPTRIPSFNLSALDGSNYSLANFLASFSELAMTYKNKVTFLLWVILRVLQMHVLYNTSEVHSSYPYQNLGKQVDFSPQQVQQNDLLLITLFWLLLLRRSLQYVYSCWTWKCNFLHPS